MVKIIFRAGALFFTGKERERLQSLCGIAKTHLHKSGQEARRQAYTDCSRPAK